MANKNYTFKIDPQLKETGDKILAKHNIDPQIGVERFYEYLVATSQVPFPTPDDSGKLTSMATIDIRDKEKRKDWFDDEQLDY